MQYSTNTISPPDAYACPVPKALLMPPCGNIWQLQVFQLFVLCTFNTLPYINSQINNLIHCFICIAISNLNRIHSDYCVCKCLHVAHKCVQTEQNFLQYFTMTVTLVHFSCVFLLGGSFCKVNSCRICSRLYLNFHICHSSTASCVLSILITLYALQTIGWLLWVLIGCTAGTKQAVSEQSLIHVLHCNFVL